MATRIALFAPAAALPSPGRWINGPWVDFLTLGGGSFVVLAALASFFPRDDASRAALAGAMLLLAHFVNHPHFAHSYQLFYRDFVRKAFSDGSPLAARYRFAGIMIPALLAAFFAVALSGSTAALLGLAGNVMFFTVGWHYAKQGYGILMLDAARKGIRFPETARRWLLANTHLVWFTWWLAANDALRAKQLWGIEYYLLDVPDAVLIPMVALAAISTAATAWRLIAACRASGALPLNGLIAYAAAAYVWLFVGRLDPILLFVVPFFHSLQYMAVVWRYRLNVEADRRDDGDGTGWRKWMRSTPVGLARFAVVGGILGAAGFWVAPLAADALGGYDRAVFGTAAFLFVAWTFINIHHYFIDNVIWRRGNPEMARHLFGRRGADRAARQPGAGKAYGRTG